MQITKLIITFGLVLSNTFIGSYVHGFILQSKGLQQLELLPSTRRETITSSSSSSSSFSQKMTETTTNEENDTRKRSNNNNDEIMPIIKNFRQVTGFQLLFRCASTDGLGDVCLDDNHHKSIVLSSPEYKILHDIGLILDLRSQSERNEKKAREWMSIAPGGEFAITTFDRNQRSEINIDHINKRNVLRIDVLSPTRLFQYLSQNWITTPKQKIQYMFNVAFDSNKLHEMRMDILKERGLRGLYEAMLETSQDELFISLKNIVEYLESCVVDDEDRACKGKGVVFHCVQGKDRTGIIAMLCQSIIGISDEIIISDYELSETLLSPNDNQGSAAATSISASSSSTTIAETPVRGKLSREIFSGSPAEVMVSTLDYLRQKYGSVSKYLDTIGFNQVWRSRFIQVVAKSDGSLKTNDEEVHLLQSKL